MVELVSVFGFLGAITASFLFFPQVWESYRTRKTHDIAWFGIFIGMLNGVFWFAYGLVKSDPFIYVTNSILFLGAFLLMVLKKKYG
ncbi:PQ-loop repeat-containing protein [Candidatus Woesearchaeota archaeon]|nr:PQ-loop repeat-containing protein [Candidatus Woesearchaeota archaeon]